MRVPERSAIEEYLINAREQRICEVCGFTELLAPEADSLPACPECDAQDSFTSELVFIDLAELRYETWAA